MVLQDLYMRPDNPYMNTNGHDNLWLKNRRRMTTTDVFNMDWFFCKANSEYNNNSEDPTKARYYDPTKDITNDEYINKDSVMCQTGDRTDVLRPVLKDRLCDGFVDCYNGDDENGVLAECKQPPEGQCPSVLYLTSFHLEECRLLVGDDWLNDLNIDDKMMNDSFNWKRVSFIIIYDS